VSLHIIEITHTHQFKNY